MSYIKKEDAIEVINKIIYYKTWSMDDKDVIEQIINCVEKMSAADVEKVKHGEWVYDGDCFHCSACNRTYQLGSLQTIYDVKRCWKYCANCGAKMNNNSKN